MDFGTGSTADVFIFDNKPASYASLPTPVGNGSRGYCTDCTAGKAITGGGGTGNYVIRVNGAWVGTPITTWSEVQLKDGTASASSKALIFGTNNIPGDFIAVGIECNFTGSISPLSAPTLAVTDTQNNTYTATDIIQSDANANRWVQIFYAPAIVGGPNTVTVTSSVNLCTYIHATAVEYSGIKLISPLDAIAAATTGNSGTIVTPSFNQTVGDLVVGMWNINAGGNGFGGTGFTLRGADTSSSFEDTASAATGQTIIGVGNSGQWVIIGAAFKRQP